MIKRLIDTLRGMDGYAGMAIFRNGGMVFYEGIEPGLADRMKDLFEAVEPTFHARRATAVIRGYTISVFKMADLHVVCRAGGHFAPIPELREDDLEYATGSEPFRLITREEAKAQAEMMLKVLMSRD